MTSLGKTEFLSIAMLSGEVCENTMDLLGQMALAINH